MEKYYYNFPIGTLYLEEIDGKLCKLCVTPYHQNSSEEPFPVIAKAIKELTEYFQGKRKEFTVPLKPEGTVFQKKVWQALKQIPYGETRSYGEIALTVGNEKACRAVGGANNKNPILIMIPCHRVIGKNGTLVGFGGGLDMKERLLQLERKNKT